MNGKISEKYALIKVGTLNFGSLRKAARILKDCGDDMYNKNGLAHWKNSYFKTLLITIYLSLRNKVWLITENSEGVATFQTRITGDSLHFSKLAVRPSFAGQGIGSVCLECMENIARENDVYKLTCEVYDKSEHARSFYEKRGFVENGSIQTLKYSEIKLEKRLDVL